MQENNSVNGTQRIKSMYENAPYPDLGANLKNMDMYWNALPDPSIKNKKIRYLDVGCGTGHYVVGVAKKFPEWDCHATDLSTPSLNVCSKLAELHGVSNLTIQQGNYSEKVPYEGQFDLISALGTIHHCEDPLAALTNVSHSLKDDGYMFMHLYGQRLDQGKFDLKEILSIFEPDLANVEKRFEIYQALMEHKKKHWLKAFLQKPLIDILMMPRNKIRNIFRKSKGYSWSPAWTVKYDKPDAPWIDHFCNPCEKAYEVPGVIELVDGAGMKIVKMIGHGREYPQLIPSEWQPLYNNLSQEDKWRLSELLAFGGGSFNMILQKK